jgi:hypothetical protein
MPWNIARSLVLALSIVSVAHAQNPPDLSGMWGDSPLERLSLDEIEVVLCQAACTDVAIERLNALLEDPANDARSFAELRNEARAYERAHYFRSLLTEEALAQYPLDPADDPTFLRCEPLGAARQFTARHQLEIRQHADRVELHYGEWDARRTVWLDGRRASSGEPPTNLGFSVGRYEGDTLVVETTRIAANRARWDTMHSEQLRIIERFRRTGDRLELVATHEDPRSLKEPAVIKRIWTFAPSGTIQPYEDCRPATAPVGEEALQ